MGVCPLAVSLHDRYVLILNFRQKILCLVATTMLRGVNFVLLRFSRGVWILNESRRIKFGVRGYVRMIMIWLPCSAISSGVQ